MGGDRLGASERGRDDEERGVGVIETYRLSCGLSVVVEPMSNVRSAGVSWLIPAGSALDPAGREGLSAMWSHLVLRGAGDRDSRAQADALDALGVSRGSDVHTFSVELSATMLGSRVVEALPLLVDAVRRPRIEEESVEAVRALCVQALEGVEDEPQERVMLGLRKRHSPDPIGRGPYGTMEGLEGASVEEVVEGWHARARPRGEGSVFAVAGAVKGREVVDALERLTKGWEGEAPRVTEGAEAERGYAHEEDETNQVQIAMAFDAPSEGSEDSALERVVGAVLSGGMSGRLFTEVREKRSLCYSVHATYGADKTYGRMTAYSGTTPERAQETLDVLWGEMTRINGKGGGVTKEEHARAVVGLKSRIVMSGESTSARASALAQDWRKLGRCRTLEELVAQVDGATWERVNERLARRETGRATVMTIGPSALRPPAGV